MRKIISKADADRISQLGDRTALALAKIETAQAAIATQKELVRKSNIEQQTIAARNGCGGPGFAIMLNEDDSASYGLVLNAANGMPYEFPEEQAPPVLTLVPKDN